MQRSGHTGVQVRDLETFTLPDESTSSMRKAVTPKYPNASIMLAFWKSVPELLYINNYLLCPAICSYSINLI
jgi:hypothetical protein